ncbi:hypothetical protein FNW02_11705 [Komarekiella sp. 'clone 1']|uniref:Uncharacterized protein n=1 Tax=Komarekiella delphini-convector SJRDD-AB1 TaxID=2593771 RepID=A0AA40VQX6_9NOST|nr:hypothetical protein [Komarekiella delphini-convector]MBD6616485.1 hypothetical protein [Komarekiella delphini-convector SJRDD-AB1]
MIRRQVIIKQIILSDSKIIAEAKTIVMASGDAQSEINQSISVNISSNNTSSSYTQYSYSAN